MEQRPWGNNMEVERLGDFTRSGKISRLALARKPDQLCTPPESKKKWVSGQFHTRNHSIHSDDTLPIPFPNWPTKTLVHEGRIRRFRHVGTNWSLQVLYDRLPGLSFTPVDAREIILMYTSHISSRVVSSGAMGPPPSLTF